MSALNNWVSDQLYALVGASPPDFRQPVLCRSFSDSCIRHNYSLMQSAYTAVGGLHHMCSDAAGYAESSVVAYVVSLAKRATNASVLATQLQGAGLPASSATQSFASELLARVPRAGQQAVSTYKQQEKAALSVAKKNRWGGHAVVAAPATRVSQITSHRSRQADVASACGRWQPVCSSFSIAKRFRTSLMLRV